MDEVSGCLMLLRGKNKRGESSCETVQVREQMEMAM